MHARVSMGDVTVKHTKRSAIALPVDQALEKTQQTSKASIWCHRITNRKEPVLKWNNET